MTGPGSLDLGFDPDEQVTVTMPLGMLHGLAGAAWTEDTDLRRYGQHAGRDHLARLVDTDASDAAIRERLVATIPALDSFIEPLRGSLRHAVDLYRTADRSGVSHLGAGWADPPPDVVPGWVWVHVLPGLPHIIVYRADLTWNHRSMPEARWSAADVRRIVEIVSEFAPVADTWNEASCHVGIRLDLPPRDRG